ncbi:hypothetical protein X777_04958 [Ooceraea biroi]|uniref:Uncharacterized protein n=1 Tax=Ooceraea biroi TaxID=2015173 RepID=A0A026WFH1_OOCBI|nr:hypothetical protein X777_04958 [Ooceraea biroi]
MANILISFPREKTAVATGSRSVVVEGPGTRGAKESVNDSKDEDGSDVASTLSGLLAGLPTLAGPQRLASSLKQKFVSNSGESVNPFLVRGVVNRSIHYLEKARSSAVVEFVYLSSCVINER